MKTEIAYIVLTVTARKKSQPFNPDAMAQAVKNQISNLSRYGDVKIHVLPPKLAGAYEAIADIAHLSEMIASDEVSLSAVTNNSDRTEAQRTEDREFYKRQIIQQNRSIGYATAQLKEFISSPLAE